MEYARAEEVTLKDIAQKTGFSLVSVHRALNGKPGISAGNRDRIFEAAKEMGYRPNMMAASLKRRQMSIAVVLPERGGRGRNYFDYMWKGCDSYREETEGFGVRIMEYDFDTRDLGAQEGEDQVRVLEEIYKQCPDLDGLLTAPVTNTQAMAEVLTRFVVRGTRVVLIDNDPQVGQLCCISPNDENTGRLSAELMCDMLPQGDGAILVAGGNQYTLCHQDNARGFADYVRTHRPELSVVTLADEEGGPDAERYYQVIAENDAIIAAYSVRARSTIPLCEAALRLEGKRKLLLLGSDLFPESANMLRRGVLRGIVYKNPYEKGYRGLKELVRCVRSEKRPPQESLHVPISVILRSNLVLFEDYL